MNVEKIIVGKDAFLYLETHIKNCNLQRALALWERNFCAHNLDSKHIEIKVQDYFRSKGACIVYLNSHNLDYVGRMNSGNKIRNQNRNRNLKSGNEKYLRNNTAPLKMWDGEINLEYYRKW